MKYGLVTWHNNQDDLPVHVHVMEARWDSGEFV